MASIIFNNIANKLKNRLVKGDTCLNKLFFNKLDQLFASDSVQNIANTK